jgi:aerobic-type carbon monoxide dehydrogenase small subunit (CoxS/CutS family)
MEYECSWIGQGERLVDSRRKNGASKKEDNKYIPLETMIEMGLIKLVQVSFVQCNAVQCQFCTVQCIVLSYHVVP